MNYNAYDHPGSRQFYEGVRRDVSFARGINGPIFSRAFSGGSNANGCLFWSDVPARDRPVTLSNAFSSPAPSRTVAALNTMHSTTPLHRLHGSLSSISSPPPPLVKSTVSRKDPAASPPARKPSMMASGGFATPTLADSDSASSLKSTTFGTNTFGQTYPPLSSKLVTATGPYARSPSPSRISPKETISAFPFYNDLTGRVPADPHANYKVWNPLACR
jgi:hypothetical protein